LILLFYVDPAFGLPYAINLCLLLLLYVLAPGEPAEVFLATNVTGAITIRWTNPLTVVHRVDRFYIRYQALSEATSYERIVDDVNYLYDVHEVNAMSTALSFDVDDIRLVFVILSLF